MNDEQETLGLDAAKVTEHFLVPIREALGAPDIGLAKVLHRLLAAYSQQALAAAAEEIIRTRRTWPKPVDCIAACDTAKAEAAIANPETLDARWIAALRKGSWKIQPKHREHWFAWRAYFVAIGADRRVKDLDRKASSLDPIVTPTLWPWEFDERAPRDYAVPESGNTRTAEERAAIVARIRSKFRTAQEAS